MSITDLRGFIKPLPGSRKRDLFIVFIIILSALGGFALGRLSVVSGDDLFIERRAAAAEALADREAAVGVVLADDFPPPSGTGSVVASKDGNKYHYPWCAGARSIKEENKIWFETADLARESGYAPAGNCKGLK